MKSFERDRRRKFGQNFLVDASISRKIVDAANLTKDSEVLEIGPGDGALTKLMATQCKHILAVEKDSVAAEQLVTTLLKPNVHILQADILTYQYLQHFGKGEDGIANFTIVSNLPYNAGTHILQMLLTAPVRPKRLVVMLQKEVADRVLAKPGNTSMLSVVCQWFAHIEPLFEVGPEAFVPRPKVISKVIAITPKKDSELLLPFGEEKAVFRLAKMGFASKRKKLSNNLSSALNIPRETVENFFREMGLTDSVRAEELSLENWLDLAKRTGHIS